MTRCFVTLLAAACLVAVTGAQHSTFRAGTDTVTVYATVVDAQGRLVPNLAREDFQVFDNGRARALTHFANEIQPITIVVMLDRSGSMVGNYEIVSAAAERFVAALRPADRARLGSFSHEIRIDPETFTSDREQLTAILRTKLLDSGDTPLWNATFQAMDALSGEDGRRVVLLFTDGYDSPNTPTANVTFEQIVSRSQAEEIMVYAIGLGRYCEGEADASVPASGVLAQRRPGVRVPRPRPLPPFPLPGRIGGRVPRTPPTAPGLPPPDVPIGGSGGIEITRPASKHQPLCLGVAPDPSLRVLAEGGGGGYFELRRTADVSDTFARVADELHHQYLLAFRAEELDGALHRLDVRARHAGLTVRARKTYLAPAAKDGAVMTGR